MSFPLFKFTLSNAISGTLEIKEPEGWDDGVLKLERNQDYHSLVEYWDQPLLFDDAEASDILTGDVLPGGLSYLTNIEYTQGLGAIVGIHIEISEDQGDTYETIFLGTIAIDTVKEVDFYKAEYGVLRDDFWAKLINRKSTPVSLSGTVDLDGGTRVAVDSITLPMPSQKIRQYTHMTNDEPVLLGTLYDVAFSSPDQQIDIAENQFIQIDFPTIILDEVQTKFTLFSAPNPSLPVNIMSILYDGDYHFNIQISLTNAFYSSGSYHEYVDLFERSSFNPSGGDRNMTLLLKVNDSVGSYAFTAVDMSATASGGTGGTDKWTEYRLNTILNLKAGDAIRIYGVKQSSGSFLYGYNGVSRVIDQLYLLGSDNTDLEWSAGVNLAFNGVTESYFKITANTIYPETTTDAFMIKDVFESVVSKITGNDSTVESAYFDGCGGRYATAKGLHIRGYSLTEKPFFQSLDDAWEGINPILNLGMGYIQDQNKIEILEKEDFYNKTPILNLDFVNNIERSYDLDSVIKSLEIGYEKWNAESDSGIDSPQSKRKYSTSFGVLGKDEKIMSKYIASDGAIEETRRNRVEPGKDWRLDDDTMIIAVVPGSPEWTPEFSENFGSITNLLNPDYRYNIRLSVAHNLSRWMNWISGCLQIPSGQEVKFASGEGNFDMTSQLDPSDCEATGATPEPVIDEKGNFEVTDDFLFTPIVYTFEHPLTSGQYNLIRNNRKNAIGISRGDTDHRPCFIMSCEFKPTRRIATFKVLLGVNEPL